MSDSPYLYQFDPEGQSTAAKVVRMVGQNKTVLEIGCAYGVMTRPMAELNHCTVTGVDIDAEAAEQARPYLQRLLILDLEKAGWQAELGDTRFDVIAVADVLEHVREPAVVLSTLKAFLKEDGYFVISIPNVSHNGIVAELLSDDFGYSKTGLLDSTHIRFFGAKGIQRLLDECQLQMTDFQPTEIAAEVCEFAQPWARLPEPVRQGLAERKFGSTYQFVFRAEPKDRAQSLSLEAALVEKHQPLAELQTVYEALTRDMNQARKALTDSQARWDVERKALQQQLQLMLNSSSWRLTRPLRVLARLARYGVTPGDRQQFMALARRLPLPPALKRVLKKILLRVMRSAPMAELGLDRMLGTPALPLPGFLAGAQGPDYVVFGVIDWHFRLQRPQQLAKQIAARGRRVFYVSSSVGYSSVPLVNAEALDDSGRLFQLKLSVPEPVVIYDGAPSTKVLGLLRQALSHWLDWAQPAQVVCMIDHPFWIDVARSVPNSKQVYDCMDYHDGFGNNAESLRVLEHRLLKESELTVVTSTWLDEATSKYAKQRLMVRNACEFEHFHHRPSEVFADPQGRRVIGYYGAIANWFDVELLGKVAEHFSDCLVLMIGEDSIGAQAQLARHPNIQFLGEMAYAKLPQYLHAFDVCLLPFQVIPLTLATNPVKVYEYLSAGKPVVSVDLPELRQFEGLVWTGADHDSFLSAVEQALAEKQTPEVCQPRMEFARCQTWQHRSEVLVAHAEGSLPEPVVSVIVLTYNNLELTKACLASLERNSDYPNLEVIVVDNKSTDDSPAYLRQWAQATSLKHKLILNDTNKGFAGGNNDGLQAASGDYLIMLNNDTVVTPGWVRTLLAHFKVNPNLGLLGPVTNNIGNEAKINIAYNSPEDMEVKAAAYTRAHMGQSLKLRTVAFFCVMMSRDTYEKVGLLDVAFGRGFFEDDDYCRRVEQIGRDILCADDVFVHHHLSASFNQLKAQEKQALFDDNKRIYEAKWGPWIPHSYRK